MRAPYLKTGVILRKFKQFENFPLPIDQLKQVHNYSAKKMLLPFITFTGMSVTCMAYELSSTLISMSVSSIVITLKEKHSLVNLKVFKVECSMFSEKGSKF